MNKQGPSGGGNKKVVVWAIRVVVFGVLAALLIVAGMQFYVKRQFEGTQSQAVDLVGKPIADLEDVIQGNPEISEGKGDDIFKVTIYTWNGPFTDYKLRVKIAKNSGKVFKVSGKSEEEEEASENEERSE